MKELENDWLNFENIYNKDFIVDDDTDDDDDLEDDSSDIIDDIDDIDDDNLEENADDNSDDGNRRKNNNRDNDLNDNKHDDGRDSKNQEGKPEDSDSFSNPEDHISGPEDDAGNRSNGTDARGKDKDTLDGKGDKSGADGKPDGTAEKNTGKDAEKGKKSDTPSEEGGPTHGSPNVGKKAEPNSTGTEAGGTGTSKGVGTETTGKAGADAAEGASAAGETAAGAETGSAVAAGEAGAGSVAATGGTAAGVGTSAGAAAGASGAAAGGTAAGSVFAVAWPVIAIILAIVLIIIIVTGFVMFFLTMPSMILGKVKKSAVSIYDGIMEMLIGKKENVKMSEVIQVADYLESMGYDLHGAGFLTDQIEGSSGSFHGKYTGETIHYKWANFWDSGARKLDPDENIYADSSGILRDTQGIVYVHSNYITKYIMSDNYVYLIKNNNHSFKDAIKGVKEEGFIGFLGSFANNSWGTGLLYFFKEDSFGVKGSPYGDGWDTLSKVASKITGGLAGSDVGLEIDRKAQELVITTKSGWLKKLFGATDHSFRYNLDGWTGRYGMPLEFLLSVHLTSMQPGLASDLADNYETEVQILLHKITVTLTGGAKVDGQGSVMTYQELLDKATELQTAWGEREQEWQRRIQEIEAEMQRAGEDTSGLGDRVAEEQDGFFADLEDPAKYRSYASDVDKMFSGGSTSVKSYIPYIYQVIDHWFRDVFFVEGDDASDIILNDKNYEALTGERWTDYYLEGEENVNDDNSQEATKKEVYSKGRLGNVQYKLYTFQYADDGTIIGENEYNGTKEQAEKEGIKVHKKAKSDSIYSAEDWTDDSGVWSAYKLDDGTESAWEQYPEDKGFTNPKAHMFFKMATSESIKQVADGQRGPTNAIVKKMFTWNKYYTYNGTEERAKAIDIDRYSGAVKSEMDSYESGKEGKESSKINSGSDDPRDPSLIETFSIDKNSLAAFDILTNMNTLDSDAIYRDFKELIVELNFFDKEELTNIPVETFEWPVPETGSGGWPRRVYSKDENEWGTLLHSKLDLDYLNALDELEFKKNIKTMTEGQGETSPTEDIVNAISFSKAYENSKDETEKNQKLNENDLDEIIKDYNEIDEDSLLALNTPDKSIIQATPTNKADGVSAGAGFQQGDWLETCQACWEYVVTENDRLNDGIVYANGSTSPYPFANSPSEQKNSGDAIDCSGLVSWCIYEHFYDDDAIREHFSQQICTGTLVEENYTEMFGWEEIPVGDGEDVRSKLQPGDILVRFSGYGHGGTGGQHHTCIYKEVVGGSCHSFDCGSQSHWSSMSSLDHTDSTGFARSGAPGKIIRVSDVKKRKPKPYEGYEPGQLVVSPATGIVIDAGMTNPGNAKSKENIETDLNESVGYVKIRVLDDTDYTAIFGENVDVENQDKDVQGYSYFLEEYKMANVTGNILYIEGFNLELLKDKDTIGSNLENIQTENGDIINKYTAAEFDDVLSKDAKKVLEAKETAKASVKPYFITSEGILISEGTALGTCYGDGEGTREKFHDWFEETKAEYEAEIGEDISLKNPFQEKQKKDKKEDWEKREITERPGMTGVDSDLVTDDILREKGNGNSLRIIMRTSQDGSDKTNEKDSVVEDVEDYIETDKLKDEESTLEKLMTWQALEPEGFHFYAIPGVKGGKDNNVFQNGHQCIRANASDKYGYDWVICNGGNNDPNLCPGIFMGWPGQSPNFGGKTTMEVCGYTYSQVTSANYDTWVTGEQLYEIYTKELEHEVDSIKRHLEEDFGCPDADEIVERMNQDQINALIDVAYKGIHYMTGTAALKKAPFMGHKCKGELMRKVAEGRFDEVTVDDFVDTNPNHPRRRIANYLMFKEGVYMRRVNPCSYEARFTRKYIACEYWNECYDYISDTPFQDLMRGVQPVEDGTWEGSYPYPSGY